MGDNLQHIAICGNIGSGKTTLTVKLAKHYGWVPMTESADDNPYLKDFYQDMARWAFHVQVHFLSTRFRQVAHIREMPGVTIQDRTLYEDGYIFAANLRESGFMNDRDYACYRDIFDAMTGMVRPPDLLIYLRADIPKLLRQIKKRDRDYEKTLRTDYLQNLNKRYDEWIRSYRAGEALIIDVNDLDFEGKEQDFNRVVDDLDKTLASFQSRT